MIFPGQPLEGVQGTGLYVENNTTRSSVSGSLQDSGPSLFISHRTQLIPRKNSIVFARVVRTTLSTVNVHILSVDSSPLREYFLGVIRLQDIRKHEIEKIDIEECFAPGDIIQARIISLGDSKSFFLSTAETELGVALSWLEDGSKLLPHDWEHMVHPPTNSLYKRKVARPIVNP